MLLVLDESGDDGLNFSAGQNPWLVIGGVLFDSREAAVACRVTLTDLHRKLGGGEFHFAKNTPHRRRAVLACLARSSFRYYAVACDKSRLDRARWRKPADVYAEVTRRVIESVSPALVECSVWFDTLGGGRADREHGKALRRAAGKLGCGKPRVKDCRACDSEREVLIQVADYVCGAVSQSVRAKRAGDEYRRLIQSSEAAVIEWPASVTKTEPGR